MSAAPESSAVAAPPLKGWAALIARGAAAPNQPAGVPITGILVVGAMIDLVLGVLKWPIALAALALLPGVAQAFWDLVRLSVAHPGPLWFFLAGAGGYVLLFEVALRRTWFGSAVSTLEHELTHALFALATVHKVGKLRITRHDGGHVEVLGGNWLISLAPYFFPTVTIAVMVVNTFLPASYLRGADVVLGLSVAYHLCSTIRETHPRQPDLRYAGRIFALALLPTANLFMYGVVLGHAGGDAATFGGFVDAIADYTRALYRR